jgi:hypothetical protein
MKNVLVTKIVTTLALITLCSFAVSPSHAAARSFGTPANGLVADFENSSLSALTNKGFSITSHAIVGTKSLSCDSVGTAYFTNAYLRSVTDSVSAGWLRISQGAVSAIIIPDSFFAQPGVGFASDSGAAVFAVLTTPSNRLSIIQRIMKNGVAVDSSIKDEPFSLSPGYRCKLEFLWSPYANAGIANVYMDDGSGNWALNASVVGLAGSQNARHPAVFCKGGAARFDSLVFDPNLDNWNYDWEFYNSPVLKPITVTPNYGSNLFANGIHWKWKKDNKFYIRFRNGLIYSSADVINWTNLGRYNVDAAVSDPCLLMDPFGDGCVYESSTGTAWYKSDGHDSFLTWDSVATLGKNNHGMAAMQDVIDTRKYPGLLDSITFSGKKYRFIGIGEQWFSRAPLNGPWSTVMLSNNLSTWVRPDTNAIPDRFKGGWEQIGDAIGCGYPMADSNIMIICCTCTNAGYTGGGFEASGVSSVLDGKQPWVTRNVSRLPMTPAFPTGWTKGPNMPLSFVYDSTADILYFFSDFGDAQEGVLRVRNFSRQGVTGTLKNILNQGAVSREQRETFAVKTTMRGNRIYFQIIPRGQSGDLKIGLVDMAGRPVFTTETAEAGVLSFSTHGLANGPYILSVSSRRLGTVQKTVAIYK